MSKKASLLSRNKIHSGVSVGNTAHMEHMLDADLERVAAIALPHEVFTKKIEGIVPHVVGEKPGEKHFTEHATFKLYRPLEGKEEGTEQTRSSAPCAAETKGKESNEP
jgi:hypothetical protein